MLTPRSCGPHSAIIQSEESHWTWRNIYHVPFRCRTFPASPKNSYQRAAILSERRERVGCDAFRWRSKSWFATRLSRYQSRSRNASALSRVCVGIRKFDSLYSSSVDLASIEKGKLFFSLSYGRTGITSGRVRLSLFHPYPACREAVLSRKFCGEIPTRIRQIEGISERLWTHSSPSRHSCSELQNFYNFFFTLKMNIFKLKAVYSKKMCLSVI